MPEPTTAALRAVRATRYVTPLREGGSMPGLVEADDDGLYVVKFRGAGQGPKALVAELVAGEIGRHLGLRVPEIVFVELDPMLGRAEPDVEVHELLDRSPGLNLGLDYLPGAMPFVPAAGPLPQPALAADIVWFDGLVTNVDRTAKNTNLLVWHKRLWLIDNGASFYFHFGGPDYASRAGNAFPEIKNHVLLRQATVLPDADARLTSLLTDELIRDVAALIPDAWLDDPAFANPEERRSAYRAYLSKRLSPPRAFVEEALRAHEELV